METMSFTATKSNSGLSKITFKEARPIRPIPFIAIFFILMYLVY